MSLARELLRQVQEAKHQKAQDEMGVPSYDNIHTPNNHVGNTSNATHERKVSGLGDRKVKKPTANIGNPHKEKGRDMEGVKGVTVKEDVRRDLGMKIQGGLLHFHHPAQPNQAYHIEVDQDLKRFLVNALKKVSDPSMMYDLLMDYYEAGPGRDPRNMDDTRHGDSDYDVGTDPMVDPRFNPRARVAAGLGESEWPLAEEGPFGTNPVAQALSMSPIEGGMMYMQSPDGQAAMLVPWNEAVRKAVSAYVTSPDARVDTTAAAARLFQVIGKKVPGVKATKPQGVQATGGQSHIKGRGVDPEAGSGLSLVPQDDAPDMTAAALGGDPYNRGAVRASVGEAAHKTADGEMSHPKVAKPSPAKTARVRGKQDDEPTNKGNPGTGHEEKGQPKKQFTMTPKDFKGGENEHKSMKKMHEAKKSLEQLLGRELDLKGTEFGG